MSDTRIVTISNRRPTADYYCYDEFFKSALPHEPLVLGQQPNEYTGLSDKPRILHHAIKNGLIPEKYLVFVDCWDVVFANSLEAIMGRYRHWFDAPIIVGAERNCFPSCFKREYDKLVHHRSSFKYLNSGVIIGKTEAMLTILEAMDAPNLPVDYYDPSRNANFHFNDQAMYMDIFLRQPVKMELDWDCMIAQNMQDVNEEDIEFVEGGIQNKETSSHPSIIHWNGGSKDKWSREPILKHLNL